MKKAVPWLYFLLSISVLASLSIMSDRAPTVYDRFAWMFFPLWAGGALILSIVVLRRWWKRETDGTDAGGFGMAALPLPRSWKRWMYDEPAEKKSN